MQCNDHYDYHHRDAACDATHVVDPANPNRSLFGKKAEVVKQKEGGKGNNDSSSSNTKSNCPDGATCKWLHPKFNQGCKFYFCPTGHYRAAAAQAPKDGWTPGAGKGKGGGKGKGKGGGGGKRGKGDGKKGKGKEKKKGKGKG